jgi:hypothetical protein
MLDFLGLPGEKLKVCLLPQDAAFVISPFMIKFGGSIGAFGVYPSTCSTMLLCIEFRWSVGKVKGATFTKPFPFLILFNVTFVQFWRKLVVALSIGFGLVSFT